MDKTVEMEMKLTIARRDLKKLLASELITATMIKGSLAKQELLTTYYDTASYKLTESGMAYRIRRNGKKYEAYADQTVWAEPFLRDIQPMYKQFGSTLDAFKSAIRANQLCDFVTPYRMDLADFSAQAPQNLTVIAVRLVMKPAIHHGASNTDTLLFAARKYNRVQTLFFEQANFI